MIQGQYMAHLLSLANSNTHAQDPPLCNSTVFYSSTDTSTTAATCNVMYVHYPRQIFLHLLAICFNAGILLQLLKIS